MILDDVANRAGLFVEGTAALDAEVLGHRNLHTFDVVSIPNRFEQRIRKSEEHHVVNRGFAEVMIDAENGTLVECLQ